MSDKDIRFVECEDVEIRTEGEGDEAQRYVQGMGIVYGREQEIFPGFFETIRKGAFDRDLFGSNAPEIKSYFNHDPSAVLATTKSNPRLQLEDTDKGVRFKAPIPPTSYGRDLTVNLERRNVRGASFTFRVDRDGEIITIDEKGNYHREIVRGRFYEIGPVTNPAYKSTSVGLRSGEQTAEECKRMMAEQTQEEKNRIDEAKARLTLRSAITHNLSLEE